MAEGSLLSDLFAATRETFAANDDDDDTTTTTTNTNKEDSSSSKGGLFEWTNRLSSVAGKVTERIKQVNASDLASIVGIDQSFTDRELRMIQSLVQGKALAHHLEDEYYAGMGRACGFLARVGEELVELKEENAA